MYILAGSLLAGCAKKLEVAPQQSIDQDQALNTENDVLVTLTGVYDGVQGAAAYGGDIMVLSEVLGNSSDIRFTGTFQGLTDAYNLEMTTNNSFARDTWLRCYNAINRANNVLSALDKVTSSTAMRNKVEGEALFLRASMYFELVKLFAKTWGDGNNTTNPGVVLVLEPTIASTEADKRPRSTVAECYSQIIGDMRKAEDLLPLDNTIFANKASAAAQLSRIGLIQGNDTMALNGANRVINYGTSSLAGAFGDLFFTYLNNAGASPEEYIFSMKVTTQDGSNSLNTYFGTTVGSIPGTAGRSDCKITATHLAKYSAGDARGQFFITVGGFVYSRKHLDRFGNVPVVRLAEMYLTRAEANLRLGTTVGATPLADVNRIRKRAGLTDLGTVTLADILKERSLELAFEGQRLHDIRRTRGSFATPGGTVAWNSPKLVLPIPQRERDVNPLLDQNEGYE